MECRDCTEFALDSAIALRGDGIQPKDTFPTGSAEEEADVAKTGFPYTHTKGKVQRQARAIWCCCENYKKRANPHKKHGFALHFGPSDAV